MIKHMIIRMLSSVLESRIIGFRFSWVKQVFIDTLQIILCSIGNRDEASNGGVIFRICGEVLYNEERIGKCIVVQKPKWIFIRQISIWTVAIEN